MKKSFLYFKTDQIEANIVGYSQKSRVEMIINIFTYGKVLGFTKVMGEPVLVVKSAKYVVISRIRTDDYGIYLDKCCVRDVQYTTRKQMFVKDFYFGLRRSSRNIYLTDDDMIKVKSYEYLSIERVNEIIYELSEKKENGYTKKVKFPLETR